MRNLRLKSILCDSGSMHPAVKHTVAPSLLKVNKGKNSRISFGQNCLNRGLQVNILFSFCENKTLFLIFKL